MSSFSFPLQVPGVQTPDFLSSMVKASPAINSTTAAIWKSPDWTLSIHTPELSSILEMSGMTGKLQPQTGSTSSGSMVAREKNPFSESFGSAISSKSTTVQGVKINGANRRQTEASITETKAVDVVAALTKMKKSGLSDSTLSRQSVSQNNRTSAKPRSAVPRSQDPLQKRRERNRVAAALCRKRKLDRINQLKSELGGLKDIHTNLHEQFLKIQKRLVEVKKEVVEHMKNGCQGFA